jgi:hypothetical protein
VKVGNEIGWRLDLVRNGADWQAEQVLVAKAEFFELIAKTELSDIALSVYFYLDKLTSQQYYESWLAESGFALNELVTCLIIDVEVSQGLNQSPHMQLWYKGCSQLIKEHTKTLQSAPQDSPFWLQKHQKTAHDSLLAICF